MSTDDGLTEAVQRVEETTDGAAQAPSSEEIRARLHGLRTSLQGRPVDCWACEVEEVVFAIAWEMHQAGREQAREDVADRTRQAQADALEAHRRRVVRHMPPGLVSRATVVADLEDYASRIREGREP